MAKQELGEFMPIDEALAWVQKWRRRHLIKKLGAKDKVIITLAHHIVEVERLMYPVSNDEK